MIHFLRCEKVGLILQLGLPNPITGTYLHPANCKNYVTYLALDKMKVAGVLSYYIVKKTFTSVGTFVAKGYRKNGLATDLWEAALEVEKPEVVRTEVISDRGNTLIQSLKRSYPEIKWVESQNGDRPLRVLKKGRK